MALKRLGKRADKPLEQVAAEQESDGVLPPRLNQTLHLLLAGHSEKQIAAELGLSRNTVHHYVKDLYKRFHVSSRAELMARWVHRDNNNNEPESEPKVKRRPSRQRAASSRRPKRARATSDDA